MYMKDNLISNFHQEMKIVSKELLVDGYNNFAYTSAWCIIEIIYNVYSNYENINYKYIIDLINNNLSLYFPNEINDEVYNQYIYSACRFVKTFLGKNIEDINKLINK